MPGFDPNEPRDPMGKWTTGLSTAIHKAASDKFTVGYSPFRVGNISDLNTAEKAFNDPQYKEWKQEGTQLADLMGIKIIDSSNTIGIYEATTNNAETSRVIEVSGSEDAVNGYAAIMGSIAPDRQMSVMVNKYDTGGDVSENYINFHSKQGAINFVNDRKKYGINDLSYSPDKNQVLILDFGNFDKNKFLQEHGTEVKNIEERQVKTRFIEENEYAGIVRKVRNSLPEHDRGSRGAEFSSILTKAEQRSKQN